MPSTSSRLESPLLKCDVPSGCSPALWNVCLPARTSPAISSRFSIIEVDALVWADAASIAEETGLRSLDSIHVASARRISDAEITFITVDARQAEVARSLGLTVLGA